MASSISPERKRVGKAVETLGKGVVLGGVALGLIAAGGMTWEGAGGQYIPQSDLFHWALIGFGGPMTSLYIGFPLWAIGLSIQGKQ